MNQVSVLDTERGGGGGERGEGIPGFPLLGEFFPSLNEALPLKWSPTPHSIFSLSQDDSPYIQLPHIYKLRSL